MRFVIGDIHGELNKLDSLISIIILRGCTKIVFLGDYIGKGLYSKNVIEYLIQLNTKINCIFLRGNHEWMFLRALEGEQKAIDFLEKYGDRETLKSYLQDNCTQNIKFDIKLLSKTISEQHLNFFKCTRPFYEDEKFLIVHAGINPENVSFKHDCEDLYFIRNKFIEYKHNIINKRIIFGHTAFKKPYFDRYKIGIDTGAAYPEYGHLTAYDLDQGYCVNHVGQILADPYFNETGDDLI